MTGLSAILGTVSAVYGVVIIAVTALQWLLAEYVTPFCMGPLMLIMQVALLVLIAVSVASLPLQIRRDWRLGILPLAINLGVLATLWFVPFTRLWLALEFRMNWQGYNEVITLVETGEIQPTGQGLATLPPEYCRVSRDCEILIDTSDEVTRVFFFTFRGVLDNFSGYMYRSDSRPPELLDFGGDWHEVKEVKPHWYWMSSY